MTSKSMLNFIDKFVESVCKGQVHPDFDDDDAYECSLAIGDHKVRQHFKDFQYLCRMSNTNLQNPNVYGNTVIETELGKLMDEVERLNNKDNPEDLIASFNIDGRWSDATIPTHIKRLLLETGCPPRKWRHIKDETILQIVNKGRKEDPEPPQPKLQLPVDIRITKYIKTGVKEEGHIAQTAPELPSWMEDLGPIHPNIKIKGV